MVEITAKQREFLLTPPKRINLLEGSVRSGKTWISLVAWALFVASMPRDSEFLMVGKTLTTLKRNCLNLLEELEPQFKFNTNQKWATLYGRKIWLEGADNERAESKIRGMTLSGAYIDEITLIPENFYYMVLSRLSKHGAKLYATTNPDSPNHYVYTDIICNEEINKQVTKFLITENTFLDEEYIEQLAMEYTGVFYQRFFLGEWVIAEGLVYPNYDNTVETAERRYSEYCVSMDYGTMNPTAMILWGYCPDDETWYAVNEYYYSGRAENNPLTDEQYYTELKRLCKDVPERGLEKTQLIIDPSAASFIALVQSRKRFKVRKADNDVMNGIRHTASAISAKKILFNDCCKNTIKEFGLYSWDANSVEDRVIKENDHAMDAVRYFVQTKRIFKEKDKNQYGGLW
jgi:PBSX family phage terminase large subunit